MKDQLETLLRAVEERHQFYAEDKLFYCTTAEDVPALVQALRLAYAQLKYLRPVDDLPTRVETDIIAILTPKGGAR